MLLIPDAFSCRTYLVTACNPVSRVDLDKHTRDMREFSASPVRLQATSTHCIAAFDALTAHYNNPGSRQNFAATLGIDNAECPLFVTWNTASESGSPRWAAKVVNLPATSGQSVMCPLDMFFQECLTEGGCYITDVADAQRIRGRSRNSPPPSPPLSQLL